MTAEILKALLTGFLAAVPLGPVLMLVVQKTMRHGRWKGFVTGLGSMCADTIYACIAMFALGAVGDFIDDHFGLILTVGGLVVMVVGSIMAYRQNPPEEAPAEESRFTALGYAAEAMICAFSNPGVIALIMALMAFFGLDAGSTVAPSWLLLCCVAAGEAVYWFVLTRLVSGVLHVGPRTLVTMGRTFGLAIAVVGLVLCIKGLSMIFA